MLIEAAPWYAHITNYLLTKEVSSEWIRSTSLQKFMLTIGKSQFYLNTVRTKKFGSASLNKSNRGSSVIATKAYVEATFLLRRQQ